MARSMRILRIIFGIVLSANARDAEQNGSCALTGRSLLQQDTSNLHNMALGTLNDDGASQAPIPPSTKKGVICMDKTGCDAKNLQAFSGSVSWIYNYNQRINIPGKVSGPGTLQWVNDNNIEFVPMIKYRYVTLKDGEKCYFANRADINHIPDSTKPGNPDELRDLANCTITRCCQDDEIFEVFDQLISEMAVKPRFLMGHNEPYVQKKGMDFKNIPALEAADYLRLVFQPIAERYGFDLVSPTTGPENPKDPDDPDDGLSKSKMGWIADFLFACWKMRDHSPPCNISKITRISIHKYTCKAPYWDRFFGEQGGFNAGLRDLLAARLGSPMDCVDVEPPSSWKVNTCKQQQEIGNCMASHLKAKGYCSKTCGRCQTRAQRTAKATSACPAHCLGGSGNVRAQRCNSCECSGCSALLFEVKCEGNVPTSCEAREWDMYVQNLKYWVTETNCNWDGAKNAGPGPDVQCQRITGQSGDERYGKGSLKVMEEVPGIERYSWWNLYNGRDRQMTQVARMTNIDGSLTPLGRAYNNDLKDDTDCTNLGNTFSFARFEAAKKCEGGETKDLGKEPVSDNCLELCMAEAGEAQNWCCTWGEYAGKCDFITGEFSFQDAIGTDGKPSKFTHAAVYPPRDFNSIEWN